MSDLIQWVQEKKVAHEKIPQQFPRLKRVRFEVKSKYTPIYNCIAFAAGDETRWWWPVGYYWPDEVPRTLTIESFIEAFRKLEYETCEGEHLEEGYERVAIYAKQNNEPTHMAKQLSTGVWASKLGKAWDIHHHTLDGLDGDRYGRVVQILRRRVTQEEAGQNEETAKSE